MSAPAPTTPRQDPSSGPIYHEISPALTLITKVVGACALLMVVLAFIFCLVRGSQVNATFFLLACNLVISSFVGVVNAWWYRKGVLEADKYWYMWVVAGVIIFQCLATDIFVFNVGPPRAAVTTTGPPHIRTLSTPTHHSNHDIVTTTAKHLVDAIMQAH